MDSTNRWLRMGLLEETQSKALPIITFVSVILLMLPAPEAMAISKCIDNAGKITYLEGECPDNEKQQALKVQPRPTNEASTNPLSSGPAADDDRQDGAILELVSVQATYEWCAAASPDFSQQHAAIYTAWREANAGALAKFENSGRYKHLLENGRRQQNAQSMPGASKEIVRFCETQFIPVLQSNVRK